MPNLYSEDPDSNSKSKLFSLEFSLVLLRLKLDPTGRAQGDCELLDLPLSRLDIRRDVYDDPDYDYYERDRNNDAPDCKGHRFYGSYGGSGSSGGYYGRHDYYDHHRRGGYYDDSYRGSGYDHGYRPLRPSGYDDGYRRYDSNRRGDYDHRGYQDDYDKSYGYHYKYHHSGGNGYNEYSSHGYGYQRPPPDNDYEYKPHYPPPPHDYKSYEPYLPLDYWKQERGEYWRKYFEDRLKDKQYWGFRNGYYNGWGSYGGAYGNFGAPDSYYSYNHHDDRYKNSNRYDYDYYDKKYFYVPHDNGGSKDWGRYGGTYGHGGQSWTHNNHKNSYDYWGFNRLGSGGNRETGLLPPYRDRPELNGNYLPPYDDRYDHYGTHHDHGHDHYFHGHTDIYYGRDYHDFLRDECSLRMVTGFRLHKGIVKKLIGVPNIYECELLCYRERDFPCNSYAFKYTVPNTSPENCYLSDRDYKELDYYTDLEPDRDCDIYTMNNRNKCGQTTALERYNSDCFWRVRSGQRLDQRVVRDSLNVKSIVDCQIECLRSYAFTCRAFSFRYGSPIIGGAIDNCQLTDLPFVELDPRIHLVPEAGFELYERGSYGHGCEPNHFHIGNKPGHSEGGKLDQLCYIGYGTPARLLPQATKKSIRVETEGECKVECTRAREKSLFQCMSLSFQTLAPKGSPNCDLSDIVQRDLLSNVDYIPDRDSWLFAWDIHNPRCASVITIGIGGGSGGGGVGTETGGIGGGSNVIGGSGIDDYHHQNGILIPWFSPGYTWRIYSVGGLPCKRGSLCQENKVAGFWYCELEGREEHAWDYCCRPDHQCGYSEGFPYQWCHVGPGRTQWRKCNDRYYPYGSNDRFDQPHHHSGSYLPEAGYPSNPAWASSNSVGASHEYEFKPPIRPGFRPDGPPDRPPPPPLPTLEDYEPPHDNHFLDPPKPGGFGQSRHWPLSYLHKEMPPNDTTASDPKFDFVKAPKGRNIHTEYEAIANLIDVIKSNEPKSVQYQTANKTEDSDDILYVQIPLPTNFSTDLKSEKLTKEESGVADKLEAVDLLHPDENRNSSHSSNKSSPRASRNGRMYVNGTDKRPAVYTRSYITKTNRTAINNLRRARENIPQF
ncbi:hypothetical protein ILUMI_11260 [Ignelater luminosus]|uniref:Apple domain-containing protein n=1 Tax=Ignelater luminosus TaxID=2038154 RepID=A0A8K0G7W9_IGNLU|nr:hypothetical protein ILUMI_11260 [Ignelater luminosus]